MNLGAMLGIKEETLKEVMEQAKGIGATLAAHTAAMQAHTEALKQASIVNEALIEAIVKSGEEDRAKAGENGKA